MLHIHHLVAIAATDQAMNGPPFRWYDPAARQLFRAGLGERIDLDRLGQLLWDENIRSVSHRYPGESSATLPGPGKETTFTYRYEPMAVEPVRALAMLDSYVYQACEALDWHSTTAYLITLALRAAAVRQLPGYLTAAVSV